MKTFIYTTSEKIPKCDDGSGCIYGVTVYRIRRNIPELLGHKTDNYKSHEQLVVEFLQEQSVIPVDFVGYIRHLRDDGIANVIKL